MAAKKSEPVAHVLTKPMQAADKLRDSVVTQAVVIGRSLGLIETIARPELTAAELAYIYVQVRTMVDALAEALSTISSEWSKSGIYRTLNEKIVPEAFEREGITSFSSSLGFRVGVSQKYYASMRDKAACMKWLKENGLGDLAQLTVNASTLSSAGAQLLENGKELDPDLFECCFKNTVSLTVKK